MSRVILGDIAISQTGPFGSQLHEEDYVSEGTPIVTVEHLGDTNFTHQNLPFISEADTKRLSKYILIEGDIVFSRVGSIDRNVYVDKNHEGWMFSGRCIRVRADKNKVNPRYLSYYFKQNSFKKMMMNLAVGATMPSLNTKIMNSIELDLLPRENQDKIANILSAIDDKIQINNQINQELEAMAKTLYDYWFVQFDFPDQNGKPYKSSGGKMVYNPELKREIPEGWGVEKLGDIAICHDSKRVPLSSNDRELVKGEIPYYGATGIMDYVNDYIFDGDYVLMAEDGSVMTEKGTPILQRISGKNWVNNHAHVLEPVKNHSCKLLMMLLKDVSVMQIKTGSIQMKINQENMNKIVVPAIPLELLFEINQKLEVVDKQQLNLIEENKQLTQLRDWLLPMLMNGQVKVE